MKGNPKPIFNGPPFRIGPFAAFPFHSFTYTCRRPPACVLMRLVQTNDFRRIIKQRCVLSGEGAAFVILFRPFRCLRVHILFALSLSIYLLPACQALKADACYGRLTAVHLNFDPRATHRAFVFSRGCGSAPSTL